MKQRFKEWREKPYRFFPGMPIEMRKKLILTVNGLLTAVATALLGILQSQTGVLW